MKAQVVAMAVALLATAAHAAQVPDAKAITAAQNEIRDRMKDPAATQFRNVRVVRDSQGGANVCGEVNAKNSYGAYTGFAGFVSMVGSDGVSASSVVDSKRENSTDHLLYVGLAEKVCKK